MAAAAAATECSLMRLEKSAMIAVLRDEPVIRRAVHHAPADPQCSYRGRSRRPAFQFERKSAWRGLLLLANFGKEGKPEAVIPRSARRAGRDDRHDALARQLFHEQFRKLGFIEYNGGLSVHSSLAERRPP